MKIRCKFIILSLVLVVSFLLAPVKEVQAASGTYSEDMPYLKGLEFNMMVNSETNRGVLLDTVMKNKTVDHFIFEFDELENVNYKNFEIVFDITLKSKLDDGSIKTYNKTKIFDVVSSSDAGAVNNFLMSVGLKDSYFHISMPFDSLVRLSPDCIANEKYAADNLTSSVKVVYEYNTVITRVDCYLRQKLTNKHGLISRFDLTWNSDFRKSLCTNVSYNLIEPETEEILQSGSISNVNGAYGYDSDGDNTVHEVRNAFSGVIDFISDFPAAIVEFVTGFFGVYLSIVELFKVVLPFIPAAIFNFLGVLLFFALAVSLWKLIKGE